MNDFVKFASEVIKGSLIIAVALVILMLLGTYAVHADELDEDYKCKKVKYEIDIGEFIKNFNDRVSELR